MLAFGLIAVLQASVPAQELGTVTGQFTLEGAVPKTKILVKMGDPLGKDKSCMAHDIVDDSLIVDPKSKGIQHIFVFIRKFDTARIPASLKASKEKEVVFDQKGCRFTPHTLIARTDQTILVKSDDDCPHNTRTAPLRNQAVNFTLSPKLRKGIKVEMPVPELLPTRIKCDLHKWMTGYWLVLDHPYAAITDKQGRFTIKGLPAGDHEFVVWHETFGSEAGGYVRDVYPASVGEYRRGFAATVKVGAETDIGTVKIPVDKFKY